MRILLTSHVRFCLTPLLLAVLGLQAHGQTVQMSGELKRWHKVTLTLDGPSSSESATPNPFMDYRMNVTFRHTGTGLSYAVPGYFAADGNAANTSAAGGNKWRAHLSPDHTGTWSYAISFRSGTNVAVDDSLTAGTGMAPYDRLSGTFTVGETDKSGRDFRGKGRLHYVGKHHLQFAGSGDYFLKAGADAPENLLSYQDFDGGFKSDGQKDNLVKSWSAHVSDWQPGDPVWQGSKGKGLIGAINYLASEGLNVFSFLTMNIGGDDRNVFPYTTYSERYRMDCSRLDQWAIVMDHGTRQGMYLHFKTQETENEMLLDNGNTGNQRKLYYRELIARFGHNLALNWNLGEENGALGSPNQSTAQRKAMAQYFYDHDPYHHHIVIHNGLQPNDLLGSASKLTGYSLQTNQADFSNVHGSTREWINKSANAGVPWVVACDEPGDAQHSLRPDNDAGNSHTDGRKNALWGNLIAGGGGLEFYFGYAHDHSDLSCQDFRSRNAFWDYCRYALAFFADHAVPFWDMSSQDHLVSTGHCLAKVGEVYVVQLKNGGSATLNLAGQSGTFPVKWFNPRTGGALQNGSVGSVTGGSTVSLGTAPGSTSSDWIVLVGETHVFEVDAGPDQLVYFDQGQTQVVVNLAGSVDVPQGQSAHIAWSRLTGPGTADFANTSVPGTRVTLSGPAGDYVLQLHAELRESPAIYDTVTVSVRPLPTDVEPPAVTIATPANHARILQGTAVPVEVTITDDIGVSEAALWVDGQYQETDTSEPYAFEVTGLSLGVHTLSVVGVDVAGKMATNAVTITIEEPGPVFSETFTPVEDAYTENGNGFNNGDLKVEPGKRISYLKFNVDRLPDPASIQEVTLSLTEGGDIGNGTLRFQRGAHSTWSEDSISGATAPGAAGEVGTRAGGVSSGQTISVDVTPLVTGNGTYTVIVTMDSGGNDIWFHSSEGGTAPRLTVTGESLNVGPDTEAPVVTITRPADPSNWPLGMDIDVDALVSDNRGVAQVTLLIDGREVESDPRAPYGFTLSRLSAGPHTVTVTARDEAGNSGSDSISIVIAATPDEQAPVVTITGPAAGAVYEDDDDIAVTATITDDYDVVEARLLVDGVHVDTVFGPPYAFTTLIPSDGEHTLTVQGVDGSGNTGDGSVMVTVHRIVRGLRAHYEFEGNVEDSSGNGFVGSDRGGVRYVAGHGPGQGLSLDGVSGHVGIGDPVVTKDFTLAFWVQTTATQGGNGEWSTGAGIVDASVLGTGGDFGVSLTGDQIAFGTGTPDTTIKSATRVTDGAWHHVAATRDNRTGVLSLFIDGRREAGQAGVAGALTGPQALVLGRVLSGTTYFEGILDDVQIYNQVLAPSQIARLAGTAILAEANSIHLGSGVFGVNFHGEEEAPVQIESTTDFQAWTLETTGEVSRGVFSFYDRNAGDYPCKFYRIITESDDQPVGETIVYQATTDFPNIDAGTVPAYVDTGRGALAIRADIEAYRGQFAAAERTFSGAGGSYDVTITTLTETDGECTYRLWVNGVLAGTFQNPSSGTDYQEASHTWPGVSVPAGATLRVEFNTHSNGLIPEGEAFAWARGRWRRIAFSSNAGPGTGAYLEENGLVVMEMENTASPLDGDPAHPWIKIEPGQANYVSGATGSGHLEFTGNTPASGPARSPLTYTFTIGQAGNYELHLRARKRLAGEASDRCNDAYVRMEGDFTSGSTHYGTSSLTQDTKLYGGNANGWGWASNLDGNGADHVACIYAFKAGETYTLTISGRSQRFNIDRLVLNLASVPDGTWQSAPESNRAP